MAKNNNLTDFLTDVANAIRSKKGTSAKINPQDFSAEIASIESGGGESGGATLSAGDVVFYDYDGTILYSYSKDEFLALSAMPELPSQEGLICQGWNYDLTTAKNYVAEYGMLVVGANYITDDGRTRLFIEIVSDARMTIPLRFNQSASKAVIVNWGDGSAEETSTTIGPLLMEHTYSKVGEYCITLRLSNASYSYGLGHGSTTARLLASSKMTDRIYGNMLKKVNIGKGVTQIAFAFQYCYSLASISLPQGLTSIGESAFQYCYSLASISLPQGLTSLGNYSFNYCYSLASISLPQGLTSLGTNTFQSTIFQTICIPQGVTSIEKYVFGGAQNLENIIIPQGVTSIGDDAFENCKCLSKIKLPSGIASLGSYSFRTCAALSQIELPTALKTINSSAFGNCESLAKMVFPQGLTSIGNSAFSSCYAMRYYDFSELTAVPTNGGSSTFSSISSDCQIIIPDALYNSWIAASNWSSSTLKSKYIKKSEWDALNS